MVVAYAISRADLVIVPTQGSQLDAAEAAKAIKLIRQQEKAFGRPIPYAILFTRTSTAIRPRTLAAHPGASSSATRVLAFKTHMHERDAFRAIFSFGGTLQALDRSKVSNIDAAITDARAFAAEVLAMLKGHAAGAAARMAEVA